MRGRKPKPSAQKLITGNPGHRRVNRAEPTPAGEAARPKFLKRRAAKIWEQYAPELERIGILTSIDSHTFAVWCSLTAEFEDSPRTMSANRISQMRALASSFGMDPSARSRFSVRDAEGSSDPADKYFQNPHVALRQ